MANFANKKVPPAGEIVFQTSGNFPDFPESRQHFQHGNSRNPSVTIETPLEIFQPGTQYLDIAENTSFSKYVWDLTSGFGCKSTLLS